MIRPRPTTYYQAIRDYAPDKSPVTLRPIAHCALCGARLSRYRFPGETRCAPCITKHTATLTADQLHPERLAPDDPPRLPRKKDIGHCPDCGGVMYRQSNRCRNCYNHARFGDPAA